MTQWLAQDGGERAWHADPIGFLLETTSAQTFFDEYLEQKHLLASSSDPRRFEELLSIEAIDAFIDGADLRQGMLELVRHPDRIDPSLYLSTDGNVIASAVTEQYLAGATVILPQLHDSMPRLGAFCRALERVLSCHIQTNIYLTPPGNQGFNTHYDNHDVFVLQLAGAKHWRLYNTPVDIPYRGEGFAPGQHDPGEVTASMTLNAGDCLYLPRGVMHDAPNAGNEPSLHITVGLITRTWADLMLEAVSELAISEPAFRRSLPPGYANAGFDRGPAEAHFRKLAELVASKAQMDNAFDLMGHEFLRSRRPDVAGVLAAGPDGPGQGDRFRRRPLVPFQLADDEGRIALIGPGGDIFFGTGDLTALETALSGAPFGSDDLATATDAQNLIRKLWANGYLEQLDRP